jgi:hypothetical protein
MATLTGQVSQATVNGSAPVEGAVVELLVDAQTASTSAKRASTRPAEAVYVNGTTTASDGSFVIPNVPYGTYMIRVTKPGYFDYYSSSFDFTSDQTFSAELQADPSVPPADPGAPQKKIRR